MENKLAIIIPAYKPAFLREALESIANQTDNRFNLYIGDDCSPYDLKLIVDEFKDKIPLTYHRFDTNLGGKDLVAQWERCIALSKDEEYIWLFSDDDVMEPNCVESFYEIKELFPQESLFHFNILKIDEHKGGEIINLPKYPDILTAEEYVQKKLTGRLISYVVEFIFSRELYDKVGGFEKFDLAWGSDFMTWVKMSVNTSSGIITIDAPVAHILWRASSENISPDKSYETVKRKINSLIENASFLKQLTESHPESFPVIKKSFRWVRFPLGEIWRNRKILTGYDSVKFILKYIKRVYF